MKQEVLRMERITQLQDGATLLNNLNLHIFMGEIMGLVCVDTLGKKELIHLIGQNTPIHYGTVYFREEMVNSYRHSSGSLNHVAVIDKHNRLVDDLSVADNIFVLRRGFKKYVIRPATLHNQLRQFTQEIGVHIEAGQLVSSLDPYQKCVVELLKAVVTGVKLVIVQDISNIISAADLASFQSLLHYYAAQGISFLYVCSHHEESFAVCDRVALMENGQVLRVMEKNSFDDNLVWPYTLGYKTLKAGAPPQDGQNTALRFSGVHAGSLDGLSFSVREGECAVLLDVNNTTFGDIEALLGGEMYPEAGQILLAGQPHLQGREKGLQVAFIQQSPAKSMLYPEMSYLDNLCFLVGERNARIWMGKKLKNSILREYLPIVGPEIYEEDVRGLPMASRYNAIYYRVHLYNPRVAVCVQPFFGADMYLRQHIIQLIDALRRKGIAVLLLAVNLSDSLVVADRLLVVQDGRLAGEYEGKALDSLSKVQQYPL